MARRIDKRDLSIALMGFGSLVAANGAVSANALMALAGSVMLAIGTLGRRQASRRDHEALVRRGLDQLRRETRQSLKVQGIHNPSDAAVDEFIKGVITYRKEHGEATKIDDDLLKLMR